MVVCQYFLRGTCKFGNNCRYEHPRDGQRQGGFGMVLFSAGLLVAATLQISHGPHPAHRLPPHPSRTPPPYSRSRPSPAT
ncbi:hypothetical protein C8Q79DRAFT_411655 [Trametes meyenii]|nr:hypothetical protein C8Q79DRAFT_411655 [Trametes meyenii]